MSQRDAVQTAYDEWGREAGFRKSSGSWYHSGDGVISVTNLQRSQYGHVYYVNQAFWLTQLGNVKYPKENKCHIRLRLGALLEEGTPDVSRLLDMNEPIKDDERTKMLVRIFNEYLLPVITRGSSLSGLRSLLDAGTFKSAGVRGPAQRLLADTLPSNLE